MFDMHGFMEGIWAEWNCDTEEQKAIACEVVWLVMSEPCNMEGKVDVEEVRKLVYGERYGSLLEQVLRLVGYWSNDLEDILKRSVGMDDSDLFQHLFGKLDEVELFPGCRLRLSQR